MGRRAAMALAALALGACAAAPAPGPAGPPPLDGSTWMLEALGDLPPEGPYSLNVAGDRVTGAGPCNTWFGGFRQNGAQLSIGPIASTRRACPALEQEQAFLSALTDATSFSLDGPAMIISDGSGATLMRLRRVE